jgi:hypothetical protein
MRLAANAARAFPAAIAVGKPSPLLAYLLLLALYFIVRGFK